MKKTVLFLVLCFLVTTSFGQIVLGQKKTLDKEVYLYERRDFSPREKLPDSTVITIERNYGDSYWVSTEDGRQGFIRTRDLKEVKPHNPQEIFETYRKAYGEPDQIRTYNSSSTRYHTQTWTWNCAKGKYRSITFKLEKGKWKRDRVHTSECIK